MRDSGRVIIIGGFEELGSVCCFFSPSDFFFFFLHPRLSVRGVSSVLQMVRAPVCFDELSLPCRSSSSLCYFWMEREKIYTLQFEGASARRPYSSLARPRLSRRTDKIPYSCRMSQQKTMSKYFLLLMKFFFSPIILLLDIFSISFQSTSKLPRLQYFDCAWLCTVASKRAGYRLESTIGPCTRLAARQNIHRFGVKIIAFSPPPSHLS